MYGPGSTTLTLGIVLVLASAAFAGTIATYEVWPATLRRRTSGALGAVVLLVAATGALRPAPLTASRIADVVITASIAAACGTLGAAAGRQRVAVACLVAVLASPLAAAGLGIALAVIVIGVRLPAAKGAAAALAALAATSALARSSSLLAVLACSTFVLLLLTARTSRSGAGWAHAARLGFGAAGAFVAVALGGFGIALAAVRGDVASAVSAASAGLQAARSGSLEVASDELGEAEASFASARDTLSSWWARPISWVPGAAQNATALRAAVALGGELASAGRAVVTAGGQRHVAVREGRVDIGALERVESPLSHLVNTLLRGQQVIRSVDGRWLVPPVREAISDVRTTVHEATPTALAGRDVAVRLPAILGSRGVRRYFIALQNPAELRGSGGILGSFAIVRAEGGRLQLERVGRDLELNAAGDPDSRVLRGPRDYISRYSRFDPARTWQNVTMSPDFPSVARVIRDLYPQSGGAAVDGVISLDPDALAAILGVTGPIEVAAWAEPLSEANVARVLYHEQYLALEGVARDQFLTNVVDATFDALVTREIRLDRRTITPLGAVARRRNLIVHFNRAEEEAFMERSELNGAMPRLRGDFLAVVTQNSSGNKVDYFLRRRTTYELAQSPSGAVSGRVTVTLRNLAPGAYLPAIVGGGAGPGATSGGQNRTYLSLYTPHDLIGATVDGAPTRFEREAEFGRNVYSAFLTVAPGGQRTVEVLLAGELFTGSDYRLDVRHQVLVHPEEFGVQLRPGPFRAARRWAGVLDTDVTLVTSGSGPIRPTQS